MDVTAAKQAEEKLRRSEESLLEAQRLSHTGSWRHDVLSGSSHDLAGKSIEFTVSAGMSIHRRQIFGLTKFILKIASALGNWLKRAKLTKQIMNQTTELFFPTEPSSTSMQSAILS